jgi:hypothetical protein
MDPFDDQEIAEKTLWAVVAALEMKALQQYRKNLPALASDEKEAHVAKVFGRSPGLSDGTLQKGALGEVLADLLADANGGDPVKTLVVQGLILEPLLQALYRIVARTSARALSRELAAAGRTVSAKVVAEVPRMLALRVGEGEAMFSVFTAASYKVLRRLDGLWSALEGALDAQMGAQVRDLARDFGSELVPVFSALRMDKLKVVRHLAAAEVT